MRWLLTLTIATALLTVATVEREVSAAPQDGIKITLEAVDDWAEVEDVNGDTRIRRPSPGNTRKFKATVTPVNTKVKIRFKLVDVSKEKGTNLNTGNAEGFDAVFKRQEGFDAPSEDGQEIVESAGDDNVATVVLTSEDYGSVGMIEAEIEVKPALRIRSAAISIIADADGNGCADSWDARWPGPGGDKKATADDDDTPKLGGRNGDGFSRYEEYRGFTVQGKFRTLDPKKKDWFYIDVDDIGLDELMTNDVFGGLNVLKLDKREASKEYVVNVNKGRSSAGEQKATPITNSNETGGAWGLTSRSGNVDSGGPNTVKFCRVSVRLHREEEGLTRDVRADQKWLPIFNNRDSVWRGEGKVRVVNELMSYDVVQSLPVQFTEYSVVHATKETLLVRGPSSYADSVIVLKLGVGEELARVDGIFSAEAESTLGEDIDATVTEFKVANASRFNFSGLTGAFLVIDDEVMSLTKVDVPTNKVTVVRGQLGTTAAAHANGAMVVLPRSYKFTKRALYGTREVTLARGDRAIIPTALLGLTRGIDGTTAAAHLRGTRFPIFAGAELVNAAIAHTFAHEATHTLQPLLKGGDSLGGHLRDAGKKDIAKRVPEEFRFLMDDGQAPGSFLTNGIATTHSPKTLEKLVLK
jgi:hypothetical protein